MSGGHQAPERLLGDRYHVVREIGRGGMGVVYLGRDLRLDMDVAIKLRGISHDDATLWLKREFRSISSLRHPNLVELYELVAHERSCYFTMEYLPGIDPRRFVMRPNEPIALDPVLSNKSTREAPPLQEAHTEPSAPPVAGIIASTPQVPLVDFARVRSVLSQLAEGLAFLHARGVIHRDVKPSNALVVDGIVKLLDFGLALERRRQVEDLAREARVVGTMGYLAPEYLERLEVSPAMDVYALGVLAFELVTGTAPFGGALGFLVRSVKRPPIPKASSINAEVPPDLDALIAQMLATDPAARPLPYTVAEQLAGALSAKSRRHPLRRIERFVGRGTELSAIADQISDPRAEARLVLVTGPSGVGKTSLIEHACQRAAEASRVRAEPLPIWRGRCHERERVPYRAFDAMIDDIATQLDTEPTLLGTIDHAAALARVFPVLAPLIEPVVGVVEPATDLRVERERALIAMTQLLRSLVPRGVIAIDDLQWADDDSLELLSLLIERAERPLTVIASWTTDEPPRKMRALLFDGDGRRRPNALLLDLPGMPETDLAELITDLAPDAPANRIAEAAHHATGNPYLADLFGRELAEHGAREQDGDPETRRLRQLDPTERQIAELASLAAGATSFHELRDLAELSSQRLASALRGLEDARVLRVSPSAVGDPVYAFYHQRLRDAAHGSMTAAVRRTRHAKFAAWYERTSTKSFEPLADHWEHAGELGRAALWAVAAGDAAFAQLSWALAIEWYQRARRLELCAAPAPHTRTQEMIRHAVRGPAKSPGSDPARGSAEPPSLGSLASRPLRAKLGDALFFGGRLAAAAEEYLALAAASGDTAVSADAAVSGDAAVSRDAAVSGDNGDHWRIRAAEALLKLGELDRGLGVLDGVLERHGQRRPRSRALSLGRALGVGARWLLPLPRRKAEPRDQSLAAAYRAIASYLSTPQPIEALEYVLRGIELAEHTGDAAAHAQGLAMLAGYLAAGTLGRFGDRLLARADRLADRGAQAYPRMVIAGARGILCTLRGDWTGMRAAHEAGDQICHQLGLERSWEASFLHSYWALGELYSGDHQRALALLDELASERRGADDLFSRALIGSYRGRVLVVANELTAARMVSRELDRTPQSRLGVAGMYRATFEAELALADHDWDRASQIAAEAMTNARTQWLSTMPAITAMIDVPSAIADLGRARAIVASGGNGNVEATRALATAQRIHRRGRSSFYAVTALRLQAQAEQHLGTGDWRATLQRATRGSTGATRIDRLAIAALAGNSIDAGALGPAVAWNTAGAVAPAADKL